MKIILRRLLRKQKERTIFVLSFTKKRTMTDVVNHHFTHVIYDFVPIPGIHVEFAGKAEITTSRDGEIIEGIRILSVEVLVNGEKDPFVTLPPEELAPTFYEKAKQAARQAWLEKRAVWQ